MASLDISRNVIPKINKVLARTAAYFSSELWYKCYDLSSDDFIKSMSELLEVELDLDESDYVSTIDLELYGDVIVTPFSKRVYDTIEGKLERSSNSLKESVCLDINRLLSKNDSDLDQCWGDVIKIVRKIWDDDCMLTRISEYKSNHNSYHYTMTLFFASFISFSNVSYGSWKILESDITEWKPVALGQDMARLAVIPSIAEKRKELINCVFNNDSGLQSYSEKYELITNVLIKNIETIAADKAMCSMEHHIVELKFSEHDEDFGSVYEVDSNGFGPKLDLSYKHRLKDSVLQAICFFREELLKKDSVSYLEKDIAVGCLASVRVLCTRSKGGSLDIRASYARLSFPNLATIHPQSPTLH